MFSNTVMRIQPSRIQVMAERTRKAIQAGDNVVDLTLGEPDFPTPQHIGEAAVRAIAEGETRYTPINGSLRLQEAIIHKFARDNEIACEPGEITVGCGGKQVIFQAFMATLQQGDEVLVPAPYWTSYGDIVNMHGGTLKAMMTSPDDGFQLQPAVLEHAITKQTRWLVLNSPSNPGGTTYTREHLLALANVIRSSRYQDFLILVDDMYEHIVFDGSSFHTLAQVAPDLRHRILTVNGVSKAYSMTGWRVGYGCGPKSLIGAMTKIQMQVNSHTSSISQAAAVAALMGPQDEVRRRCRIFQDRRDLMLRRLGAITDLRTPRPLGAFYLFPDARAFLGRTTPEGQAIADDDGLATYLLKEGIAVVPGSAFGMAGFLRLSYATGVEQLDLAADRLASALLRLQ